MDIEEIESYFNKHKKELSDFMFVKKTSPNFSNLLVAKIREQNRKINEEIILQELPFKEDSYLIIIKQIFKDIGVTGELESALYYL